eukprot:g649.t1
MSLHVASGMRLEQAVASERRLARGPTVQKCSECGWGTYCAHNFRWVHVSGYEDECKKDVCVNGGCGASSSFFSSFVSSGHQPQRCSYLCQSCFQGTYNTGAHTSLFDGGTDILEFHCKSCEPGRYDETPGATSCKACEQGSYSYGSYITSCIACAEGSSTNSEQEGASECTLCALGKYSEFEKNHVCTSCPQGSATNLNVEGASQCTLCGIGSYSEISANSICTSCPQGSATD